MTVEIFDAERVAAMMRCSVKTIEEKARRGELPGILWGDGGWVFPAGALAQRLDEIAREQARYRAAPQRPAGVLQQIQPKRRKPPELPFLHPKSER